MLDMPASVTAASIYQRELLVQLGSRLAAARKSRGLSVSTLARELGVSRTTLYAVEAGSPSVTIGTVLRVLGALGLAGDMVLLATGTPRLDEASGNAPGAMDLHKRQDERSLALHKEAVRVLRKHPERAQRAMEVLARWGETADARSSSLRQQWHRILEGRRWELAVEDSERGRQLRQASPLGFVLDPAVRDDIMRRYSRAALRETLAA